MTIRVGFSIVIPVFNEEKTIQELYNRINRIFNVQNESVEILFVSDGSKDETCDIITEIKKSDSRVRLIKFSRNFGQHVALTAGLDFAKGAAVILMDADLQDPPEVIIDLIGKYRDGYDVVYAVRNSRKDSLLKRLSSRIFYLVFKHLGDVDLPPGAGVFRIMSRRVVDSVLKCREKSRFLLPLINWVGFRSIGVEFDRDERYDGKSHYNFFKASALAFDAIISFSRKPLRFASYLGFTIALLSVCYGFFTVIKKLVLGFPVIGYATIVTSIFSLAGIQMLMLGIIGEYIARIFSETQNRPLYVVEYADD